MTDIGHPTLPLATQIPSYAYQEYADDLNITAFFDSYNNLSQTYLDWANQNPLSVWSNPNISGLLLDWVMNGIYGIERPVFSSLTTRRFGGLNSLPLNTIALNGIRQTTSGSATLATDDYYKRVGTWTLYAGNGRYFNIEVLRLKVARFIYGANGGDVTLSQAQTIHITPDLASPAAAPTLASTAGGTIAARTYGARATYVNSIGETLAGPAASLTVAVNRLLIVDSPPVLAGATGWYPYVGVTNTAPLKLKAGLNSLPLNTYALNGTNRLAISAFTRQATTPIAIGTNWTEPTSGLVVGAPLPTTNTSNTPGNFLITVPAAAGAASHFFQQAFNQGILPFPFMFTATVVIA